MKVEIRQGTLGVDVHEVVGRSPISEVEGAEQILRLWMAHSAMVYVGSVDDKVACVWGLLPPTVLSNRAYLWLLTTDLVEDHTFVFVRHSQRIIEDMLEAFDLIVGHANVTNTRGIRWLRWLGAEFGDVEGFNVPFQIRKR